MKKLLILGAFLSCTVLVSCSGNLKKERVETRVETNLKAVQSPEVLKTKYANYYQSDYAAKHAFAMVVMDIFKLNHELYYSMQGQHAAFQQLGFACIKDGSMTFVDMGVAEPDDPYVPMALNTTDSLKQCIRTKAREPLDFKVVLNNSILSTGLDFENPETKQLIVESEKDHILTIEEYLKISSSVIDKEIIAES